MSLNDNREFALALKRIAERLSICHQVTQYDTADEKQAWTLAHDFLDMAESFRTFLNDQLPRVTDDNLSAEALNELLLDIGEQFRHVQYHIRNSKFYAYLGDE